MKIKKLIYILIVLFSIHHICAQRNYDTKEVIELWPNKVPGENEVKKASTQTNNTKNNVKRLTDVTNPHLTIFHPNESNKNGASVIICPGGGYQILAIDLEGYEIAEWLTSLGFTAFVLEYRVPQKQEGALMDIQRALRIVRNNATEWKLDSDQIGILGFSAGASLSARISTNFNKKLYPFVDTADKHSAKPNFSVLVYPAYLDKGPNNTLTPELTLDKNTPPMFIFATADDPFANSALVMASALRSNKTPVELHLYAKGGHGYGLRPGNEAAEKWPVLAEDWFTKILK
ncbi:alpha/beta hydrolase [Urechidicola vernalis]|uniref:Alpha/beta hydrolase n=1 Tax=Urechidicola vernalis TaxID=3075600 RepID=A0ABU2Y3B6_9FLAO|nr:alpha/beta hydrolase [Urechidicola sp. P050]MDT0552694.1 alpha/beta hydrolase [Urechidicola sp. P050]